MFTSITSYFERLLINLSAESVTGFFIVIIFLTFCFSLYASSRNYRKQFVEITPTLLISLGILGTFTGIVIGLLHFNYENVDESISKLLDGLKTAFISSLVGILGAVIFDFLNSTFLAARKEKDTTSKEVTPADIHYVLEEQNKLIQEVTNSLVGSEEGSIVGQLKLLRSDQMDLGKASKERYEEFKETTWKKMDNFAELLSETATKHIISALEQVIKDFNNNLIESFGENFKALDASVKKMVDWQEEYKNQIKTMGDQYQQSVDSLVETKSAVAGIWEECKEIPLAMAELRNILQINQHQIEELERHLEVFIEMRNSAIKAVPTIQTSIEEVSQQLLRGANSIQREMSDMGLELQAHSRLVIESVESSSNQMIQAAEQISSVTRGLDNHLKEAVKQAGSVVDIKLERLEQGIARELEQALTVMGQSLVRITERFISDYKDMVQAMEQVVSMTKTKMED